MIVDMSTRLGRIVAKNKGLRLKIVDNELMTPAIDKNNRTTRVAMGIASLSRASQRHGVGLPNGASPRK